jgi:hypothetical protein
MAREQLAKALTDGDDKEDQDANYLRGQFEQWIADGDIC